MTAHCITGSKLKAKPNLISLNGDAVTHSSVGNSVIVIDLCWHNTFCFHIGRNNVSVTKRCVMNVWISSYTQDKTRKRTHTDQYITGIPNAQEYLMHYGQSPIMHLCFRNTEVNAEYSNGCQTSPLLAFSKAVYRRIYRPMQSCTNTDRRRDCSDLISPLR